MTSKHNACWNKAGNKSAKCLKKKTVSFFIIYISNIFISNTMLGFELLVVIVIFLKYSLLEGNPDQVYLKIRKLRAQKKSRA